MRLIRFNFLQQFDQLEQIRQMHLAQETPNVVLWNATLAWFFSYGVMQVRRVVDQADNSHSLVQVLIEMRHYPDQAVGWNGAEVPPKAIDADRKLLLRETKAVCSLATKEVAHAIKGGIPITERPKGAQLRACATLIESKSSWYRAWMTGRAALITDDGQRIEAVLAGSERFRKAAS